MSLNILDFRIKVLAEIPKNPEIYVERLILDGIQEICKETSCFRETITGMQSEKDIANYAMTVVTNNVEVIGFWQGKYNDVNLNPISNRQMDTKDSQWEIRTGTPSGAIYDGDIGIRFDVTPDTTGTSIELEAIIQPDSVEGIVPPRIERRHLEAVKAYVKWKIYEHPKTLNPALSDKFERDYTKRKNRLKIEIMKDGDVLEVKSRSFVTGRNRRPRTFSFESF